MRGRRGGGRDKERRGIYLGREREWKKEEREKNERGGRKVEGRGAKDGKGRVKGEVPRR